MEPGSSVISLQQDTGERLVPLPRELGVTSFGINQIMATPPSTVPIS